MNTEITEEEETVIELIYDMDLYLEKRFEENVDPENDTDYVDPYGPTEMSKCRDILDDYLDAVAAAKGDPVVVMSAIERTMLALNELNKICAWELIEWHRNAQKICDLINQVATKAGVGDGTQDLTEKWHDAFW